LTKTATCNNIVITMPYQSIFKAGNSNVVTIPTELMKELNLKIGEKVVVEKSPVGQGFLVKKAPSKRPYQDEMLQWFKIFVKENGAILDELAVR